MTFRRATDSARKPRRGFPLSIEPLEPRWTPSVDVLTYHYDNARDGQNLAETALTPANVNVAAFGKRFALATDGYVYAQPLLKTGVTVPRQGKHDVLLVATQHDSVYAFDAQGNNPARGYLWKDSFINPSKGVTPVPSADTGSEDISPEVGITGTPVIDPKTNTLYVVAKTKEVVGGKANYVQRLHALDIASGAEKFGGPEVISASVPGGGGRRVNFNALTENQRASLALVNGVVYIAWASHGDNGPFHGRVIGYKASDVRQQVGVFNSTPTGSDGGIWMSGGGISADAIGNLFVGVGNGTFDANRGGRNYGDSAVKLSTASGLTVADSFTPKIQQALSDGDLDFGVSDVLLLPDQIGTHPHEAITTDKVGRVYIMNRDNLGGSKPRNAGLVGEFSSGSTLHNNIAYSNGSLFVAGDGAHLKAFPVSRGVVGNVPTSQTTTSFGAYGKNGAGANPIVTANGARNGIVWALDNYAYSNRGPAVLHAYLASNLSRELYNSNQAPNGRDRAGAAVKFTAPVVANGLVYVPGESSVTVYGRLGVRAARHR